MTAENRCIECGHEWEDAPGDHAKERTLIGVRETGEPVFERQCPKCGSLYWLWKNFNQEAPSALNS